MKRKIIETIIAIVIFVVIIIGISNMIIEGLDKEYAINKAQNLEFQTGEDYDIVKTDHGWDAVPADEIK